MRTSNKVLAALVFASTLLGACGKGGGGTTCPTNPMPSFSATDGSKGDGGGNKSACQLSR